MEDYSQLDAIAQAYEKKRDQYVRFADKLCATFREILIAEDIDVALLEARAKSVESFRDKIKKPGKLYREPLVEITDLCGIRVIAYTTDSVVEICELIEREFEVDWDNSHDKADSLKPNEFGYLSRHYVLKLKSPRRDLLEYSVFSSLKAEIQVRTVLQHAWAAIDHRLRYKTTEDSPAYLARPLFRLSGMLELADEEFAKLDRESKIHRSTVTAQIEKSDLTVTIDADSLKAYLKTSQTVERLEQTAIDVGFLRGTDDEDMIADLAKVCRSARLGTIGELEQHLGKTDEIKDFFADLWSNTRGGWLGSIGFFVELAIISQCYDKLDLDSALEGWSPDIKSWIAKAIASVKRN